MRSHSSSSPLPAALLPFCYAELAAMIPIAAARTHIPTPPWAKSSRGLSAGINPGKRVSNMAVSVGFSAHLVDLLDWFGLHPDPKWISPAYLPSGLPDLQGNMIYGPAGTSASTGRQFIIVMLLP